MYKKMANIWILSIIRPALDFLKYFIDILIKGKVIFQI